MGLTVPTSPFGAVHEEPPVQNEVRQQDRHNHDLCESSLISKPGEMALAWSSGYGMDEGSPKTLQWVGSANACGVFRNLCCAKVRGTELGPKGGFMPQFPCAKEHHRERGIHGSYFWSFSS